MGRTHRRRAVVGLLAATLVGAGCTDDDGGGPSTTTSSSVAAATTTSGSTATTVAPSTTAAPGAVPPQVTGVTASTGGGSGETVLTWLPLSASADVVAYKAYKRRADGTNLAPVTIPATIPPIEPGRLGVVDAPDYQYWPSTEPDPGPRCYKVSAVTSAGVEGPQSAEACASPVGG